MQLQIILVFALVLACPLVTQATTEFRKIEQGDIVPHDNRLTKPINESKADDAFCIQGECPCRFRNSSE